MTEVNKEIEKYVKERDEMLEKFDIDALDDFVSTHSDMFRNDFMLAWKMLDVKSKRCQEITKWLTLCNMIFNCTNISEETKLKAQKKYKEIRESYGK